SGCQPEVLAILVCVELIQPINFSPCILTGQIRFSCGDHLGRQLAALELIQASYNENMLRLQVRFPSAVAHRGKPSAPPPTVITQPVVCDERSLASQSAASATASGGMIASRRRLRSA